MFFSNLRSPAEGLMSSDGTGLWSSLIGSGRSAAGVQVTPDSALAITVLQNCVTLLAESVAQLPLEMYRRLKTTARLQPLVVRVLLYGVLGTRFGRVHHLAVTSGAEAVHALCVTIPGFKRFLRFSEERGLTYAVFRGKQNLAEGEVEMRSDSADPIRIAPIVIGSKGGGIFATIAGLALIVVGAISGQYYLSAIGAGVMLGGMAMSMSPSPAGLLNNESDGNKPSYAFGGAITTTAQGRCKPLLYGERDIGGAIGSAGIYAEDQQ